MRYFIASGNPAYTLATNGLAANGYEAGSPGHFTPAAAFITEVVMTMLFLYIILGATDRRAAKGFGPLAIGLDLRLMLLGAAIAGVTYRFLTGAEGREPIASQGQRISQATTSIGDVTSSRPTPEA